MNVSVDHASDVQTARYSAPLSSTGPCVRQCVSVESKSAVFISVLRVSLVDYLIYISYAADSNPVTDHETARLFDVCGSFQSPQSQTYRLNENNPNPIELTITLTLTLNNG